MTAVVRNDDNDVELKIDINNNLPRVSSSSEQKRL